VSSGSDGIGGTEGIDGVVLVHGGFHGAWCWHEVRPHLTAPTVAVDLPGRGKRPAAGRRVTVADCVDAVLEDADAAGFERFVLVGHSMGGLTITETANRAPDRVARLVYVAALALAPGQTIFGFFVGDAAPVVEDPTGVQAPPDEATVRGMFAGDVPPDTFRDHYRQLVPEPIGLFIETVSGYDSGVPATYVRCTRDATVDGPRVDDMLGNLRPDEVVDLDADHDVMLSRPELLVDVLNRVVAGSGTRG
jgi:pimeloyl-ACP methyl ester carboxylesterase